MRILVPSLVLAFSLVLAALPASAQSNASIEIRVNAHGPDATFSFVAAGPGMPATFQIRTTNGQGSVVFSGLDVNASARSVNLSSMPAGWKLDAAACTTGFPWNITVWAGVKTTCVFQLEKTHPGSAWPPASKPAKPAKHDHDRDDDDRDHDDEREGRGGGFGWWKTAPKHVFSARLNASVANVSAASAWLMPPGYAANASGAVALLVDSTKHCQKRLGKLDCELLRFEARLLVLRLNLDTGRVNATANVTLANSTASFLGLPNGTTLGAIVDALEARAGGAAETLPQLRTMREAAQRANAHG